MKQGFAIFLSALMALSFLGCKSSGLHTSNTVPVTTECTTAATTECTTVSTTECTTVATTEATTIPTETAVPMPDRELHTRLEFYMEGMVEYQDATLYVGDGYSLYITDDDWIVTTGENGEVTWVCEYNPDIMLWVIPNAGVTFDQVKDTLFHGYVDVSSDGEYVYGCDHDGSYYRSARLINTQKGILAAVWDYSLEAIEGFGVRLSAVADTLEPTNG